MKKNWLRCLICVGLALAMLVSLSACGDSSEGDDMTTVQSDFVYVPEYVDMPSVGGYVNNAVIRGDRVYYYYTDYSSIVYPETEEEWETWEEQQPDICIVNIGVDGSDERRGTVQLEETNEYIQAMVVGPEGNYFVLSNFDDYYFDEDGMYHYNGSYIYCYEFDGEGNRLARTDLSHLSEGSNDYFYVSSFLMDNAGNMILSCNMDSGSKVLVLDGDMNIVMEKEMDYSRELFLDKAGNIYTIEYEYTETAANEYVHQLDLESDDWAASYDFDVYSYNYIYPALTDDDFDIYIDTGLAVFGYTIATGEKIMLLNWIDAGLAVDWNYYAGFLPDGQVSVLTCEYDDQSEDYKLELILLSPVPASEVEEKEIITIGGMWIYGDIKNMVVDFNKRSTEYQIRLVDYSIYSTNEDYTAGRTRLMTEIAAGAGPDILLDSNLNIANLASKGVFEDLYTYIDSDPDMSREVFFANALAAMEVDGLLPVMPVSFSIQTMAGMASVLGDEPGWTIQDMLALLDEYPDLETPLGQYMTRESFLWMLLYYSSDEFFDWKEGKCYLDTDEFAGLLEIAARFPESYEDEGEVVYMDDYTRIRQGDQLVTTMYISGPESFLYNGGSLGEDVNFIGVPVAEGVGHILSADQAMGITSSCDNKEAAWSFIRLFYLEEYQESQDWVIPIRISAYDKLVEKAMEIEYYEDMDGEQIPMAKAWVEGENGEYEEIYAMTQAQADLLRTVIDAADKTASYDDTVLEIVQEEAAAYFAGDKTAAECTQIIQSRVQTYMSEQM